MIAVVGAPTAGMFQSGDSRLSLTEILRKVAADTRLAQKMLDGGARQPRQRAAERVVSINAIRHLESAHSAT